MENFIIQYLDNDFEMDNTFSSPSSFQVSALSYTPLSLQNKSFEPILPLFHKKEIKNINNNIIKKKPSKFFCKTGFLDIEVGEKYDQELHSYSNTVRGRSLGFYNEYEISQMEKEIELYIKDSKIKKPSKFFCKTGFLDIEIGEQYDQEIHYYCETIRGRSIDFYSELEIIEMENIMKYCK